MSTDIDFRSNSIKAWIWDLIVELLPDTLKEPTLSEPLYSIATSALRAHQDLAANEKKLRSLANNLVEMILKVDHEEHFGSNFIDHRIQGLCQLMYDCVFHLKAFKHPLNLGFVVSHGDDDQSETADSVDRSVSIRLFDKFLFPKPPTRPVANVETRQQLYELVLAVCEDAQALEGLVSRTIDSLRTIDIDERFIYHGRPNFLRAECGLVGLGNLGQTCYMNSLLQQLFMNVSFRTFILESSVADHSKQRVLLEFQKVFASMQGSYNMYFSPDQLAPVLDVDITSQEDAHIFFTTLIGKLEDSMVDEDAKKRLRTFFGGRNKSQTCGECGHVSESTDEYCNLSLVVKDKASLLESLQEYVEGAPLEGGDKFKCLTCESNGKEAYVNAMRRTGLEHIPDNLVLGLKRFQYETWDGGAKVNDEFNFPQRVDMGPYKLTHLGKATEDAEPDMFELVGVIVHQGTLQFGHYWTYAMKRLEDGRPSGQWYRLEDSQALPSDLPTVMRECRGGLLVHPNGSTSVRSDSAYILFYQRIGTSGRTPEAITQPQRSHSADHESRQASVPKALRDELDASNNYTMFITHLFDAAHSWFVKGLVRQLEALRITPSSVDTALDTSVLEMIVRHFNVILSHQQSLQGFEEFSLLVQRLIMSGPKVAICALQWLSDPRFSEYCLLHGRMVIRQQYNRMIITALRCLREQDDPAYGFSKDESILFADDQGDESGWIHKILQVHEKLRDRIHHYRAAWATYLDLVVQIAGFGPEETALVLDQGWLFFCLSFLYARFYQEFQDMHREFAKFIHSPRRLPLAAFVDCIFGLLNKHVALQEISFRADDTLAKHSYTDQTCSLDQQETDLLLFKIDGVSVLVRCSHLAVDGPTDPYVSDHPFCTYVSS